MSELPAILPKDPEPRTKASIPIHALILLLYGMVLTLPAIWPGFIFGDDTVTHLIWSRLFADQFWAGDLYPRWLTSLNAGLGGPVFQFYAPVPFYITALFRPLLSNDPEGWHQLGLAVSLAVIASGFTAYSWLKRQASEGAALIGAVLYMSAPYHLAVSLYMRFAFGELWGFVWMPLVMLFARASIRGGRGAMVGLSLSYALLIMTHLPTILLFSLVPVTYVLWMAEPGDRSGPFVRVTGGMLIGIGLSAIYLVPAMTTQEYVQFDVMKSGIFYFANNFLFNGPYENVGVGIVLNRIGLITMATVGVSILAMLIGGFEKKSTQAREKVFWGGVGAVAVFMMLPISEPLWRFIPVLQVIQFPLRFGAVLLVPCAALVTLAFDVVFREKRKLQMALLLGATCGLLAPSVVTVRNWVILDREIGPPRLVHLDERFRTDYPDLAVRLNAIKNSRVDFLLTRWAPRENLDSFQIMDLPLAQFGGERSLAQDLNHIQVIRWQPPLIELEVKTEVDARIKLHQYFYPGWLARLDDGKARLEVKPSSPDGLLEVQVPPGTHRVLIEREALPEERVGQVISGISLALFVFVASWPLRRRIPDAGAQGGQ